MKLKKELQKFKGFIFDCDGVIWRGENKIEGVDGVIRYLRREGKRIVFLTNNSTKTREEYAKRLKLFGIDAKIDEIVTSGYVTAQYLREKYGRNLRLYIIGESGLIEEMKNFGFTILSEKDAWHRKIDVVVVGLDRKLTYEKLAAGAYAILNGAKFIATNADPNIPTEKGLLPGAGAIVSFLKVSTGIEPEIVIGKPSVEIMNFALKILGTDPENTLVVGDRIETDIIAAKRARCKSLIVLTGATTLEEVKKSEIKPDFILESLLDMVL